MHAAGQPVRRPFASSGAAAVPVRTEPEPLELKRWRPPGRLPRHQERLLQSDRLGGTVATLRNHPHPTHYFLDRHQMRNRTISAALAAVVCARNGRRLRRGPGCGRQPAGHERHGHVRPVHGWFVEWPAERPELDLVGCSAVAGGIRLRSARQRTRPFLRPARHLDRLRGWGHLRGHLGTPRLQRAQRSRRSLSRRSVTPQPTSPTRSGHCSSTRVGREPPASTISGTRTSTKRSLTSMTSSGSTREVSPAARPSTASATRSWTPTSPPTPRPTRLLRSRRCRGPGRSSPPGVRQDPGRCSSMYRPSRSPATLTSCERWSATGR